MNFNKRVNGSWVDTPHYIHNTSTDTLTTLPAVLYPNDTTATVGLKGNMSQTGTPTPQNPIQPSECGERTVNLMNRSDEESGYINSQGEVRTPADGWILSDYIPVVPNSTYTFNPNSTGGTSAKHAYYDSNKELISVLLSGEQTFITPNNAAYMRFSYRDSSTNIMLNTGSTAKPFEPYGYKIPISSGGVTTNEYLGQVQTTRKVKKLVLTGEEAFTKNNGQSTNYLYYANRATILSGSIDKTPVLCNELPVKNSAPQTEIGMNTNNVFSVVYFNFGADVMNAQPSGNTVDGLKEYLAAQYAAGTPVTVWYVLATETTGIVNEPIRKIGDYADEISGITIPTTAGANTLSIGTTLQPSEVTVNYKGWHSVQSVHERESGAWT